jgi:hypothetical protein
MFWIGGLLYHPGIERIGVTQALVAGLRSFEVNAPAALTARLQDKDLHRGFSVAETPCPLQGAAS